MSDNQWGCPCCGHVGNERLEMEKLTSRVAELEVALLAIKSHQQALTPNGFEFSSVWQIADKALKESE